MPYWLCVSVCVSALVDDPWRSPRSEAYEAGRAALLYSFPGRLRRYVVPCFVSDGDLPADDPQAQAAWR
jgi:hypothetical protein